MQGYSRLNQILRFHLVCLDREQAISILSEITSTLKKQKQQSQPNRKPKETSRFDGSEKLCNSWCRPIHYCEILPSSL